jgi:predicted metal-dependent hydrolase
MSDEAIGSPIRRQCAGSGDPVYNAVGRVPSRGGIYSTLDKNSLHAVSFGNERIEFRLRRSKRKTLGITVEPDMSVLVTAPRSADVEKVKAKVRKRAVWIRRQWRFFQQFLPQMPPRLYVSGETHRYLGRQYRLKIVPGVDETVKLKGRFLWVMTRRKGDASHVRELLESWFMAHARIAFERRLAVCMADLDGQVKASPTLRLRRMRKRWGSCTKRGDIYLNPELIQAPAACIDYVVTHELCHLVHPHHGLEFHMLLRQKMPDCEARKARLERVELG